MHLPAGTEENRGEPLKRLGAPTKIRTDLPSSNHSKLHSPSY
jgi:hypothetical protein